MTPARRSRIARRASLALVVAALGAGVGIGGELASADAPVKQGWWSRWQTDSSGATTLPTVPAGAPLTPTTTVPPPPTGDDGGLTVANGPDGPEAVAAMFFQTEGGGDGSLYLRSAPRKKDGTPDPSTSTSVQVTAPSQSPVTVQPPERDTIVLPDDATVLACRALSSWERDSNGPWSKRPTWATDDCVPGTLVAGNTAMFWTLFSTMQDGDGNYDIVLVPSAPVPAKAPSDGAPAQPQQPFMVNFASPGSETLVADPADEDDFTTDDTLSLDEEEDDGSIGDEAVDDDGDEFAFAAPEFTPAASPVIALPTTRTPTTSLLGTGRPALQRRSIFVPDTRMERLMAVSLLFFIAFALWWLGGSPTRGPRLLGAAGGRTIATAPTMPLLRGVGRFARERLGRPPRL